MNSTGYPPVTFKCDQCHALAARLALVENDLRNAMACWHAACHDIAVRDERLAEALPIVRDLTRQITEFTEREGEADFYTGVAVEFLKKQTPCNHVWAKRLRGKDTCAVCGVAQAAHYPVEFGPSEARRLGCSCGNSDPDHVGSATGEPK